MLIAHISDTHLGATQYGKNEREDDFYNVFNEAIDIIIKEHVKLVIHSGDIFDNPRPIGTAVNKLLDELKRLEERNIKFLFVLGEHDISRLYSIPLPFIYKKVKLAHHLSDKYTQDNLTVIGYNKYRLNEIDRLEEELHNLESLQDNGKKILVLHQGLKEFNEFAGELSYLDLPKNFDYYAMGHLHNKGEKWFNGLKGPVCYPGSTEVTKFEADENLDKGFYLVDLSGSEAKPQWIKLPTRKHMIIDVDNNDNIDNYINNIIDKLTGKPVIKIRFNNIDIVKSRIILRRLEEHTLHIIPEYRNIYSTTSGKKGREGMSIDEMMLEYAENILGNKEKAQFAINELLPILINNKEEACELLWDAYKTKRFEQCLNV